MATKKANKAPISIDPPVSEAAPAKKTRAVKKTVVKSEKVVKAPVAKRDASAKALTKEVEKAVAEKAVKKVRAPKVPKDPDAPKKRPGRQPKVQVGENGPIETVATKPVDRSRMNPANLVPKTLEPIRYTIHDLTQRRLGGPDIEKFRARHNLTIQDTQHALALHPYPNMQKATKKETLPYCTELLIRLYDQYPGPVPWGRASMAEAFDRMYGKDLERFEKHKDLYKAAKLLLYRRFAAIFFRDVASAYRWIEQASANSRLEVERILQKASDIPDMRRVLEDMARLTMHHRGINFDQEFPLPAFDRIAPAGSKGRRPKPLKIKA